MKLTAKEQALLGYGKDPNTMAPERIEQMKSMLSYAIRKGWASKAEKKTMLSLYKKLDAVKRNPMRRVRRRYNPSSIDDMIRSYIETALWSSTDESDDSGGSPLDENYGPEDLTRAALAQMKRDCKSFASYARPLIKRALAEGNDWGRIGHDFWLTRNRHGAGFWDGPYSPELGRALTDAAHSFGEAYLQVYRGKIHHG